MKTIVVIFSLGTAILFTSCASTIPEPTETHSAQASRRWPGTTVRDLVAGRRLYVLKCSGCHSLYPPQTHTAQSWEKAIPEMMTRAKLTREEAAEILRYLVVMSEAEPASGKR